MHVHVIHSSRTKGGKDGLLGNRWLSILTIPPIAPLSTLILCSVVSVDKVFLTIGVTLLLWVGRSYNDCLWDWSFFLVDCCVDVGDSITFGLILYSKIHNSYSNYCKYMYVHVHVQCTCIWNAHTHSIVYKRCSDIFSGHRKTDRTNCFSLYSIMCRVIIILWWRFYQFCHSA